jgi:hypothetical protein
LELGMEEKKTQHHFSSSKELPSILTGPTHMLTFSGPIPDHGLHLIHSGQD